MAEAPWFRGDQLEAVTGSSGIGFGFVFFMLGTILQLFQCMYVPGWVCEQWSEKGEGRGRPATTVGKSKEDLACEVKGALEKPPFIQ